MWASFSALGTSPLERLMLTIAAITGATVEAHSLSNFVGTGSSSLDFTGIAQISDSISSPVVGSKISKISSVRRGREETSGDRLRWINLTLSIKKLLKISANDFSQVCDGSGDDFFRFHR